MCMRDKISCASCKREIDDDDTCVSLRKKMEQIMSLIVIYVPKSFKERKQKKKKKKKKKKSKNIKS